MLSVIAAAHRCITSICPPIRWVLLALTGLQSSFNKDSPYERREVRRTRELVEAAAVWVGAAIGSSVLNRPHHRVHWLQLKLICLREIAERMGERGMGTLLKRQAAGAGAT